MDLICASFPPNNFRSARRNSGPNYVANVPFDEVSCCGLESTVRLSAASERDGARGPVVWIRTKTDATNERPGCPDQTQIYQQNSEYFTWG